MIYTLKTCDPQMCYELEYVKDKEIAIFELKSELWLKINLLVSKASQLVFDMT